MKKILLMLSLLVVVSLAACKTVEEKNFKIFKDAINSLSSNEHVGYGQIITIKNGDKLVHQQELTAIKSGNLYEVTMKEKSLNNLNEEEEYKEITHEPFQTSNIDAFEGLKFDLKEFQGVEFDMENHVFKAMVSNPKNFYGDNEFSGNTVIVTLKLDTNLNLLSFETSYITNNLNKVLSIVTINY